MVGISESRIEELLIPYLTAPIVSGTSLLEPSSQSPLEEITPKLSLYLHLLTTWNQRTNLTAIRNPEEMVTRHFGESLFSARVLAGCLKDGDAVLDIGSGAGFPGLPLQLFLPKVKVTLAESQGKKAAFLREAVRVIGVGAEVWAGRAQVLPDSRFFQAVTMRAVDKPQQAVEEGMRRLTPRGWLLQVSTENSDGHGIKIPCTSHGVVLLTQAQER